MALPLKLSSGIFKWTGSGASQEEVFRGIYQQNFSKVRQLIFQLCGAENLEDLVQETFLKAWKGVHQFRGESNVSTWLFRIAVNVARDYRRQKKNRSPSVDVEAIPPLQIGATGGGSREANQMIISGLEQMSSEHREVIVLHYFSGESVEAMAKILKTKPGTIKSRLHYGREYLLQYLRDQGAEL